MTRKKKQVAVALVIAVMVVSLQRRVFDGLRGRGFVQVRGLQLMLNGEPFFAHGFNAYWLMAVAAEPSQRPKVSAAFRRGSALGLAIARIWAFSDGSHGNSSALQISPGVYDERVFQGLDFVVAEARRYGIRLILSLANNYDSFGGKAQYVSWARSGGRDLPDDDAFFIDPLARLFYKNNAKAVITRVNKLTGVAYRDDPAILAWELMNEPRCPSDPSGASLQSWIVEMAAHVKALDGNHLLEAGLEGFYGPTAPPERRQLDVAGGGLGADFIANNRIQDIDFATVHAYPDLWLPEREPAEKREFLERWLDAHLEDAREKLRKPLLVAEFGGSSRQRGFSMAERDAIFGAVFSRVYWSAGVGAVGAVFWQALVAGMESYGDGYELVLEELPSTTSFLIENNCRKLTHLSKRVASLRLARGSSGQPQLD
ncbi:mannan endo-1,4-beta-mannosidase 1-like [Wolffia australiana]